MIRNRPESLKPLGTNTLCPMFLGNRKWQGSLALSITENYPESILMVLRQNREFICHLK